MRFNVPVDRAIAAAQESMRALEWETRKFDLPNAIGAVSFRAETAESGGHAIHVRIFPLDTGKVEVVVAADEDIPAVQATAMRRALLKEMYRRLSLD